MTATIIASWQHHSQGQTSSVILPDGCQDLIFKQVAGQPPNWFISPLYDEPTTVKITHSCTMVGYRLLPGTAINTESLLKMLGGSTPDTAEVASRIAAFTSRSHAVTEMLSCMAQKNISVKEAASDLGVHVRSLQRHIVAATGRTASYWIRLARVRRTARAIRSNSNLLEIAYDFGFSDQSHMTREFRHWLGQTPQAVKYSPVLQKHMAEQGYG